MSDLIRMRELSQVFGPTDGTIVHACIARLAVLYEDLRAESFAIAEASIPSLDVLDDRYRIHYFLRRSIATLVEFAETIRLLETCPAFQSIRSRFPHEIEKRWNEAPEFFRQKEPFLKRVRNDIGGHFGQEAAKYAIEHLDPAAVGEIELLS